MVNQSQLLVIRYIYSFVLLLPVTSYNYIWTHCYEDDSKVIQSHFMGLYCQYVVTNNILDWLQILFSFIISYQLYYYIACNQL
jgi:hypothetical protein